MSRTFSLGGSGEGHWSRLEAAYQLEGRGGLAVVLSDDPAVMAEARARLGALAPALERVSPEGAPGELLETLGRLSAGRASGAGLPVAWIEAPGAGPERVEHVWKTPLAALNRRRDALDRAGAGVFVVLAGPVELRRVGSLRAPDIWAVANPIVTLGRTLVPLAHLRRSLSWLHLSDARVGERGGWKSDDALAGLIRDLPRLVAEAEMPPDLVLVTGDLARRGRPGELRAAGGWLRELVGALDLDPAAALYLVPGEHDVDRRQVPRMVCRDQESTLDLEGEEFRDEVLAIQESADDMERYGARLRAYCDLSQALLGPARGVVPARPWRVDVRELDSLRVGVASLCSVWMSGPDDDAPGRVVLGEQQVRSALAALDDRGTHLRFVLLHHPLEWLHPGERRRIRGLLRNRANIVLHGHRRVVNAGVGDNDEQEPGASQRLLVSACGAASGRVRWQQGVQLGRWEPRAGGVEVCTLGWDGARWSMAPGGRSRSPLRVEAPAAGEIAAAAGRRARHLDARLSSAWVTALAEHEEADAPASLLDPADDPACRIVVVGAGAGGELRAAALAMAASPLDAGEHRVPLLDRAPGMPIGLGAIVARVRASLGVSVEEESVRELLAAGRAALLVDGAEVPLPPESADELVRLAREFPRAPVIVALGAADAAAGRLVGAGFRRVV